MVTIDSFRFIMLFILCVLITTGCTQHKKKNVTKTLVTKDSTTVISTIKNHKISARDSIVDKYIDNRKPHIDSIEKWNAQVIREKEKFQLEASIETGVFSINSNTGEVVGCPLLTLKGIADDSYWNNEKIKRNLSRSKFEELKPKIRSVIMQDKKGESWYDDSKNTELEGTQEAAHSGRGPTGFLYTDDGTHLIVPVGYPHGGMTDELSLIHI